MRHSTQNDSSDCILLHPNVNRIHFKVCVASCKFRMPDWSNSMVIALSVVWHVQRHSLCWHDRANRAWAMDGMTSTAHCIPWHSRTIPCNWNWIVLWWSVCLLWLPLCTYHNSARLLINSPIWQFCSASVVGLIWCNHLCAQFVAWHQMTLFN